MKTPLAVRNAVKRLRVISTARVVCDAKGRVLYEGYPTAHEVEKELLRCYRAGAAKTEGRKP